MREFLKTKNLEKNLFKKLFWIFVSQSLFTVITKMKYLTDRLIEFMSELRDQLNEVLSNC